MKLFINHLPKNIWQVKTIWESYPLPPKKKKSNSSLVVKDEAKIAGANVGNTCLAVECMLTPL